MLGNDRLRIALLKPGEVFGEMSLLSGDPTGADVRAVKPSGILYISARDFRQMLNKYAALQMYFTRLLTRRLTNINLARAEEFSSGMIGRLSEMPPSELFQTLNSNLKTGVLVLELREGTARVCFRDGEIIHARYRKLTDRDAFFQILRENRGRFKFMHGQCETHRDQEPIGDFMWLLMEGVNRIDEAE
ncbi:hypothetical protein DENIS_4896 [Desulfonema ishimotonii]|uniref:Cyclic nucleotide-binding domain-containing protein n=1 Tax=Desulfonema ishimotonii TaxID=45657 RepID=A0A401G3T1_9BACT|nr:DUF4388 domain-containing protein [Desulfonema ishimotonii]GBC63897.1 hypothetical protein DENIS_4896 [Desulfonema ishimotonii]